jgi:hypothetical protein
MPKSPRLNRPRECSKQVTITVIAPIGTRIMKVYPYRVNYWRSLGYQVTARV